MRTAMILGCLLFTARAALSYSDGLIYAPEGDAIVIVNGTRWNNRPLYCHERFAFVWSGEMPRLQGEMGTLYAGYERDAVRVPLHQFESRIMRYRPGRMEWECSDDRFPGLTVTLEATTLADATGFTARMTVQGSEPGDRALWSLFLPPGAETATAPDSFHWKGEGGAAIIRGHLSDAASGWEKISHDHREDLSAAVAWEGTGRLEGEGLLARMAISDETPRSVAVAADDSTVTAAEAVADADAAFEAGMARALDYSARLVIDTPDPYLNAAAPVSVSASAGVFVDPTFVHGGSLWRMRMPGWRTMGGSMYYGWLDRIHRAIDYWGQFMITDAPERTGSEYSETGTRQVGNSRFFGKGFLNYPHAPQFYEFQTQFFDEAIRAWRASGDTELEAKLLPMLELHLERAKECFDGDDTWIYDSYNNTWPNDSIWFNGGGTPEQSAYVYYGHRAAADMYRRAGDPENAARHDAIADKIQEAVDRLLWMPERGHYASYVEPWGHERQMPDAWIYGQHVPIEAGLASKEQAWRAMYYTEWAMERFHLPYGEMRQSSNFLPGQWSVRELVHGDNFGMALGYFLAGQGDEGWQLMRGAMIESMYGDGVPKSGYSRESGVFNLVNHIAPGGLSHPNCSIDFTDITSMFCRALIEGLFGYRPDYPNGLVRMEPSFPAAWDRASIRTPDFGLRFEGQTYELTLARPAAIRFGVPVRAARVTAVTLNGEPVEEYEIEPWVGYGMLRVVTPVTDHAVLRIETEGEVDTVAVVEDTRDETEPGHHLVIHAVDGDVPRYQFVKVHVPERENPKVLREAPADAAWALVDLSAVHNGDLRTIFKQRYDSPRPDRVSMRIAYDGWASWTFAMWGIPTPEIQMDNVLSADNPEDLIQGDRLVTAQQAQFVRPAPDANIAFTSLWDNWPESVRVPVNAKGEAVWLLVAGSTTPMQGKIANAVIRFHYADGEEETLELVPPDNFWSITGFGRVPYSYERDGFSLPEIPPPAVQLGDHCRAMVYGWKLRPGVELSEVSLETLSLDVVIGLMGVSIMNPGE